MAYAHVSGEVITRLTEKIDHENSRHGYLFLHDELDSCWDDQLGDAILSKAQELHLKPAVVISLLESLLEHRAAGSRELANFFIKVPPPTTGDGNNLMVSAMEALTSKTPDAGWSYVWPIIRDYSDFGRALINSMSYKHGGFATFLQKLTEAQVGDLYAWLLTNYPPNGHDHKVSGVMAPTHTAVMFRDHILEHLKKRRTFAACAAIRNVAGKYPEYGWLRLHLDEAELLARAATWQPTSPKEFLKLTHDKDKRMVETGANF